MYMPGHTFTVPMDNDRLYDTLRKLDAEALRCADAFPRMLRLGELAEMLATIYCELGDATAVAPPHQKQHPRILEDTIAALTFFTDQLNANGVCAASVVEVLVRLYARDDTRTYMEMYYLPVTEADEATSPCIPPPGVLVRYPTLGHNVCSRCTSPNLGRAMGMCTICGHGIKQRVRCCRCGHLYGDILPSCVHCSF